MELKPLGKDFLNIGLVWQGGIYGYKCRKEGCHLELFGHPFQPGK